MTASASPTGQDKIKAPSHALVALAKSVHDAARACLPAEVRACYLFGSHCDGTAVTGSDIDILLVWTRPLTELETQRFEALTKALSSLARQDLSIRGRTADAIEAKLWASLTSSGRWVAGDDILSALPPPNLQELARESMHFAAMLAVRFRRDHARIGVPLEYPQANGEFFGYDEPGAAAFTDVAARRSTKQMLGMVSRMATALLIQRGQLVGSRSEAFRLYANVIGGPWAPFLQELEAACRSEWHYLVPDAATDQQRLRKLCGDVLAFENYFMDVYADYLSKLEGATSSDPRELLTSTLNYLLRMQ